MKGDITRATFRPQKHYHGVLMQQGRVQLDSDWNEAGEIGAYLDETTRMDTIGRHGVPKVGGGFGIRVAPGDTDLLIGVGRLYVGGLLCELEASQVPVVALEATELTVEELVLDDRPLAVGEWLEVAGPGAAPQLVRVTAIDAAARTLTVAPDLTVAPVTDPSGEHWVRRVVSYTSQPDLPAAPLASEAGEAQPAALTLEDGSYLAYVDAWLRHITDLDDPGLQEPALGGPDTTTRAQTVAQVRLKHLGAAGITDCAAVELPQLFAGSTAPGDRPPSTGRLAARARPADETADACEIPPDARYQGLENQLYRVEVHEPGELGTATFKWSRENGFIATLWTGQTGDRLEVSSAGRDAVLGFRAGQLVELLDDTLELAGRPGTLVVLDAPPTDKELFVDPGAGVQLSDFPRNPKVRRWDCAAAATIEIPTGDGFLTLEDGVEVRFEPGYYNTGDYWLIPARTATRDVDWPRDAQERPVAHPPAGITHHYAPLALVEVAGGSPTTITDCRDPFPSLTTITADDVSFDNEACALPGARTVQDALDAMCEESTLRRHKKHLHGWGIVCGLRVACGPDEDDDSRRHVTVGTGYAIDCDGNDLVANRDEPLDVFRLIEQEGLEAPLDDSGNGDVSLYLDSDPERGIVYRVEKYESEPATPETLLAGTIIERVRDKCIQPVQDLLKRKVDLSVCGRPDAPSAARESLVASLLAQVLNPTTSQLIYASRCEHEVMARFYAELRELLSSETYCAMFDDASPFPDYPDPMPEEMDTIFGLGHHQRIRLRPGGREAYTVGGGLNPVHASTLVHRFDLEQRVLLERHAAVSGTIVTDTEPDAGSGPIHDVAFSPDGDHIYVIAPTENGENTFFRSGRIERRGIVWGELVTICDVQLVTLTTTPADKEHVYAAGLGKGIYRIDPRAVDPSMAPIQAFPASGHLVATDTGELFATALKDGSTAKPPTYERVIGVRIGAPAEEGRLEIELPASGRDDLAVTSRTGDQRAAGGIYVAVDAAESKQVLAYRVRSASGQPLSADQEAEIGVPDSPLRLAPYAPTGVLLVLLEDEGTVERIDMATNELVQGATVPVHVGPVSIAVGQEPAVAYTLDYWSDTITVIPREELGREQRFPLKELAAYRRGTVHAFRDLLAGALQYLKDCICDELLVACPTCTGEEKIYLASISIRGNSVYKVCNFSRRKYVKSFPTVDYWLSAVPIMPLIQKAVEEFCCMVLPDLFKEYEAPEYEPEPERRPVPRVRYSAARSGVGRVQAADVRATIREAGTKTSLGARLVADAATRTLARGPDRATRTSSIVGGEPAAVERRLADRGIAAWTVPDQGLELADLLPRLFDVLRTPREGDEVMLHQAGDRVAYYSVVSAARRVPGVETTDVRALAEVVRTRDAELAALREKVEGLEAARQAAEESVARLSAVESDLRAMDDLRTQVTRLLGQEPPPAPAAEPPAGEGRPPSGGRKRPQRRRP